MEILITEKSSDYELLDSGDGERLERFGKLVLNRPDPQVLWSKSDLSLWEKADAVYLREGVSGKWKSSKKFDKDFSWKFSINNLTFNLSLNPSKHVGVFPEQASQWKWLEDKIKRVASPNREISVLNLFGYTGGASLAAAKAGANVVHLDASEFAVNLAKKNLADSELGDKQVRFIVDDVRKFVEREIKRGNKYDIILLDPPVYGKGTKKEVWKIEKDLLPLLKKIPKILSKEPVAIVLNGYASVYSSSTYAEVLKSVFKEVKVTKGELSIKDNFGKILNAGIFARAEF